MLQHICIIMFIIVNYFVMSNISSDINLCLQLNFQSVKFACCNCKRNKSASPPHFLVHQPGQPKVKRQAWCKSYTYIILPITLANVYINISELCKQ